MWLIQQAADEVEKGHFQCDRAEETISNTCLLLEEMQFFEKAESWRREWLPVLMQRDGVESPEYAAQLHELGWNLLQQKKYAEAIVLLSQELAIVKETHPVDWSTQSVQAMIGKGLLGQGKFIEAETNLLGCCLWIENNQASIPSKSRPGMVEVFGYLIELYKAWHVAEPESGYGNKSDEWEQKLSAIQLAAAKKYPPL